MAAVCGVMRANAQSHQPSVLPSVDPLQAFVGQFLPPSGGHHHASVPPDLGASGHRSTPCFHLVCPTYQSYENWSIRCSTSRNCFSPASRKVAQRPILVLGWEDLLISCTTLDSTVNCRMLAPHYCSVLSVPRGQIGRESMKSKLSRGLFLNSSYSLCQSTPNPSSHHGTMEPCDRPCSI